MQILIPTKSYVTLNFFLYITYIRGNKAHHYSLVMISTLSNIKIISIVLQINFHIYFLVLVILFHRIKVRSDVQKGVKEVLDHQKVQ